MGKSFLIETTSQWADKILREGNGRQDPDMPTVLLLAYTGVAANNIGNNECKNRLMKKRSINFCEFQEELLSTLVLVSNLALTCLTLHQKSLTWPENTLKMWR